MLYTLLSNVFYTKFVNDEDEGDGTCIMLLYAGSQTEWGAAMRCKELCSFLLARAPALVIP